MEQALICATDIQRSLDGFHLGPVSITLEPGLVYAVVGPNGSGKTTLFNLLTGLIQPQQGSIERFGQPLVVDDLEQTRRIGFVPEMLVGFSDWRVHEINELYRRSYPGFDQQLLREIQSGVELHKTFSELSKGLQRRAMLAVALAAHPDVLICDEPTDGIDPFARQEMLGQFASYMESGDRTLLIATHNLEDIRRIADVVIVLENGRHIGTWDKDELLEGWMRIWLVEAPGRPLQGEVDRVVGGNAQIVTRNLDATRADIESLGIQIVNTQPLDMVESLRVVIRNRGG